ncbi:hypothetical protein FB45DRAFT_509436 [Roridomyces roridus]|uniref:Uncharacterized protein n=1 Tax=Roridomyces roridus TaxID=1738132 RepID=A0AAD7BWE9_9AGAR|nr:hypothetical protein FB45DRAFT_509436 [Roridomyces roridus]
MSSPLYSKLLSISQKHATPASLEQLFSIRAPHAIHAWGHNYLLSRNPKLANRMDNDSFMSHVLISSKYLDTESLKIHDIIIDTESRKSAVHMSYFLVPKGSTETIENDLIWMLKFTDDDEVDKVLIEESVEFIDATASARMGTVSRQMHNGELDERVRGGLALQQGIEQGGLCYQPSYSARHHITVPDLAGMFIKSLTTNYILV